jgi:hypothetical protein
VLRDADRRDVAFEHFDHHSGYVHRRRCVAECQLRSTRGDSSSAPRSSSQ